MSAADKLRELAEFVPMTDFSHCDGATAVTIEKIKDEGRKDENARLKAAILAAADLVEAFAEWKKATRHNRDNDKPELYEKWALKCMNADDAQDRAYTKLDEVLK